MKKPITLVMLFIAISLTKVAYSIPVLNSLTPGATMPTIYLDFDGQVVSSSVWNNGNTLTCAPSGLTDVQITEIFNRVAEDFRPWQVNVTTDLAAFTLAPLTQRIRIIVTPTSAWYPGVGGISYVGSFVWGDDTPGFVFTDKLPVGGATPNPKMVAEACSHESGHTLFLSHQSRYDATCGLTETYHSGLGSGEIAWAPIMGNSYYRNMSGWSDGPTPYGCVNTQDNLTIISTQNGFTYRNDDYGQTMNASTVALNNVNINTSGIITTTTDKDAFRLTLPLAAGLHLSAKPFSVAANDEGADVDLKIQLYNSAGALLRTYDPATTMSVSLDTSLNAGTYYIMVDGTGNANVSEYGSLGSYTLTGFTGALPIHDVSLTGNSDKGKHNLNWNIVADEPIKTIQLESSADGVNFKLLTTVNGQAKNFSYVPFDRADQYYRIKATSVINQSLYSNTIVLRGVIKGAADFTVSTLIHDEITVKATENYQYLVSDANGRIVSKGNASKGISNLNMSNQPNGLYLIQLLGTTNKQTERIIKQ